MKKILKKIGWGVLLSGICLVLFAVVWGAYNIWPRPMEPEIWIEEKIALPTIPVEKNGWNLLWKGKEQLPKISDQLEQSIYDVPRKLIPPDLEEKYRFSEEGVSLFWADLEAYETALMSYPVERQKMIDAYQKLLDVPYFIDVDPVSIAEVKANLLLLRNVHRIGWAHILERAIAQDWERAYSFWLKMFLQDKSWLESARGILSHMIAIDSLAGDIGILMMLTKRSLPDSWGEIKNQLRSLDFSQIDFEGALAYEYRQDLDAIENNLKLEKLFSIPQGSRLARNLGRYFYNPALTRKDLNIFFRSYADRLDDPLSISDNLDEEIREKIPALKKNRVWWFSNPVGKSVSRLVLTAGYGKHMKEFYQSKETLQKNIQLLLGEQN